jgi:hypothetical protein
VSEAKLSALGALGAGLLVGTALAVILPEGFQAFQAAQQETGALLVPRLPTFCCTVTLTVASHTVQARVVDIMSVSNTQDSVYNLVGTLAGDRAVVGQSSSWLVVTA